MSPKLKPYPQPKVKLFPAPEGIPLPAWSVLKGIERTALYEQLKHGYWKLIGPNGVTLGAQKGDTGEWRFHPDAVLVFPERAPWGSLSGRKKPAKRGYPRSHEVVGKRKINKPID